MSCSPWTCPSSLKIHSPLSPNRRKSFFSSTHRAASASPAAGENAPPTLPPLLLHDSLDAAGIDTHHAREGREGFSRQITRLTGIYAESSIVVSRGADLGRVALHIAAEDDSLVSHSSVPLPVGSFIHRLDDLSIGFCSSYLPPHGTPPEVFLTNLERYLYVHKGFRRTDEMSDTRALYLHSALTCRSGSVVMLSLIYSEILKMLRISGFLDFDAEIYCPNDLISLPRGYNKHKSKISDEPFIITSKSLLVKILRNLKDAFWPFQYNRSSSLFLRAVHAANHIYGHPSLPHDNVSALEIASAKAAQHRLQRGVWTSVRFGDMRRALAACERLILLNSGNEELRDYAVLLYHIGYYQECLQYLTLYQDSMNNTENQTDSVNSSEENAVKILIARVNLILGQEGWTHHRKVTSYWSNNHEPW